MGHYIRALQSLLGKPQDNRAVKQDDARNILLCYTVRIMVSSKFFKRPYGKAL